MRQPTKRLAGAGDSPPGSLRGRIRSTPGIRQLYRLGVFVAGAVFVILGAVLSVLPGPLTIPPVLLGLWIWSTEFGWARRLLASARGRATRVWRHSRAHPLSSTLLTVSGLAAVGVAVWAVQHYELLTRTRDALLP